MIALIDNTVLTNFARAEGEQLLRKVFGQNSAITENVLAEFVAGVQLSLATDRLVMDAGSFSYVSGADHLSQIASRAWGW